MPYKCSFPIDKFTCDNMLQNYTSLVGRLQGIFTKICGPYVQVSPYSNIYI